MNKRVFDKIQYHNRIKYEKSINFFSSFLHIHPQKSKQQSKNADKNAENIKKYDKYYYTNDK